MVQSASFEIAMYKSKDISRFMREHVTPCLAESYQAYKKRFLVRMRGNFVEGLIIGVGRGGWVRVYPTFYVVGADLADDGIHQTVSLETKSPRRWHFAPETPLNGVLAREILERLAQDSPIPFISSLNDDVIDEGLRWFGRDKQHWAADLFLAFFNMTRGTPTARADLARAFELFRCHSRLSTDKPLRDWEEVLRDRFMELEVRLDREDCIASCRTDAETHAKALGLPSIAWPPEWPESVPPWPKEAGVVNKLGKLFKRV